MVKYLPANAGDGKRHGIDTRVRKILWKRKWQPLQYSCLENPMNREVWWATVHMVAKSQTWLKWLSTAHMYKIDNWWEPAITQGTLLNALSWPKWDTAETNTTLLSNTPIFLKKGKFSLLAESQLINTVGIRTGEITILQLLWQKLMQANAVDAETVGGGLRHYSIFT